MKNVKENVIEMEIEIEVCMGDYRLARLRFGLTRLKCDNLIVVR